MYKQKIEPSDPRMEGVVYRGQQGHPPVQRTGYGHMQNVGYRYAEGGNHFQVPSPQHDVSLMVGTANTMERRISGYGAQKMPHTNYISGRNGVPMPSNSPQMHGSAAMHGYPMNKKSITYAPPPPSSVSGMIEVGDQPLCASSRWRLPPSYGMPVQMSGSVPMMDRYPAEYMHSSIPPSMQMHQVVQPPSQPEVQAQSQPPNQPQVQSRQQSQSQSQPSPQPHGHLQGQSSAQSMQMHKMQMANQFQMPTRPPMYNLGHPENAMMSPYLRGFLDGQRSGQRQTAPGENMVYDLSSFLGKKAKRRKRTKEKGKDGPKEESLTKKSLSAFWSTFLGERVMLVKRADRDQPVLRRGIFVQRKSSSSKHNVGILCDCCKESFTIYGWTDHCEFCYIRGPRQHLRLERNGKRLCDAVDELQAEQKKKREAEENAAKEKAEETEGTAKGNGDKEEIAASVKTSSNENTEGKTQMAAESTEPATKRLKIAKEAPVHGSNEV